MIFTKEDKNNNASILSCLCEPRSNIVISAVASLSNVVLIFSFFYSFYFFHGVRFEINFYYHM